MIYVGLDLHKRYITACALDAEGALLAASRRLPADWPALAEWLAAVPTPPHGRAGVLSLLLVARTTAHRRRRPPFALGQAPGRSDGPEIVALAACTAKAIRPQRRVPRGEAAGKTVTPREPAPG